MSTPIKRTRLLITLLVTLLLAGGTVLAIQFAKGYRPNLAQLALDGTGLLSATSYPKNAQVFINDRLTTVTDDTLNLTPELYQVKIMKTGFLPWIKTVSIKPELVSTTDARLFPSIPSLTPLTFYQVSSPLLSPDGSKLVYTLTNSPFSQDNGVYVLSLANSLFPGNQIIQIADLAAFDYRQATFAWSPDGSQILALFHDTSKIIASHLLNPRNLNQAKNLTDTTFRLPLLLNQWQDQQKSINLTALARFPEFIQKVASESAVNVYFSPDREKILYTAIKDLEIPENLTDKAIPSINPTPQNRKLGAGKTYVYDLKEDSNFLITEAKYDPETAQPLIVAGTVAASGKKPSELTANLAVINLLRGAYDPHTTQNLGWYTTSRHLIITGNEGLSIVEYDDNNLTPIIPGPVTEGLAVPSPDGTHLIILSNLNQQTNVANLISLDLK
ncbi:MAG TPA: PEGA domain-containing protein [Patescibacteria group bacterium]|nr:PEGA domain-containing protein [Patescibacteria group bacterium]